MYIFEQYGAFKAWKAVWYMHIFMYFHNKNVKKISITSLQILQNLSEHIDYVHEIWAA